MKQFKAFEAMVPANVAQLMVQYWQDDENSTRDEVIASYYDEGFKHFCKRVAGTRRKFQPDLGYTDKEKEGTLCFEVEDNNIVIPINILEII